MESDLGGPAGITDSKQQSANAREMGESSAHSQRTNGTKPQPGMVAQALRKDRQAGLAPGPSG